MSAKKSIKQVSKPTKKRKISAFWIAVVVWAVFMAGVMLWFFVGASGAAHDGVGGDRGAVHDGAGDSQSDGWPSGDDRGSGLPEEIRNSMLAAVELEPFLNSAQGVFSANAREKGWDSLAIYAINWGVVLSDGTVVLNPAEGYFQYDKHYGRPSTIQWSALGGDVMIIYDLDLPEAWREHRIIVVPGMDETTHFVNVTQPNKLAQDAPAEDTACGLWQWQDGAYSWIGDYIGLDDDAPGGAISTV